MAEVTRAELEEAVIAIADGEAPCWLDHDGGCQEHGYLSLKDGERCPIGAAIELGTRLRS